MGGAAEERYAGQAAQASWTDTVSVTFFNITDPYHMETSPEPEFETTSTPIVVPQMEDRPDNYFHMPMSQASGLDALSAAATASFQYMRPTGISPGDTPHSSNNLNFILNPAGPEGSIGKFLESL
jgi:hypothetical protein